jgi:hypothetical protein
MKKGRLVKTAFFCAQNIAILALVEKNSSAYGVNGFVVSR